MAKKNVIWFFVDQLRRDAIGINGDLNVRTPNIDNLAKQGVNFERAVGGYPLCCPCRSSILSGQYPQSTGVAGHEQQLKRELPLVSDVFNAAGYDTVYFGKWHLEGSHENQHRQIIPRAGRGRFQTFLGYENNNSPFDVYVHGHRQEEEIAPFRLSDFETVALTDLAIQQLDQYGEEKRQGREQPFFMVVSLQPPHDPYIAPAEHTKNYQPTNLRLKANVPAYPALETKVRQDLAGYYGSIETIDHQLGRLQAALRQQDLAEDTHVLFFSDHGDMHGSHGLFRKTNPYEEAIGVPFIIGGAKPLAYEGYRCGATKQLLNHVDIAPTTLGLCDLAIPEEMVGTDFSALRQDKAQELPEVDSVYLQNIIPTMHGDSTDKPWRGVLTADDWKYICLENQEWLLFDLQNDPGELINLAHNSDYQEVRVRLHRKLSDWIEKTKDDFSLPVLPYG